MCSCLLGCFGTSALWFKAHNWFCGLTLGWMMHLLMHACVTPGPEAPPVGHSPTRLQWWRCNTLRRLFLSLFFSLTRHACWNPVRKKESQKNPNKKQNHRFRPGGNNETVPTQLLLVRYTAWSFQKHHVNTPVGNGRLKLSSWFGRKPSFPLSNAVEWPGSCTLPGLFTPQAHGPDASRPPDTSSTNEKWFKPKRKEKGRSVR